MPSPELMNICTDSAVKAVKTKKFIFNQPQKHVPMQEPKRPDFITAFIGCMDLPLWDAWIFHSLVISGGRGEYSPTLSLEKKIKEHKTCW